VHKSLVEQTFRQQAEVFLAEKQLNIKNHIKFSDGINFYIKVHKQSTPSQPRS